MLIASKYEEIWAPEVNDFVCISDRAYTYQQVLTMEKRILGELEWYMTVPTPYVFLVRFIKASLPDSDDIYFETKLVNYIDLALSRILSYLFLSADPNVGLKPLKLHTWLSETTANLIALSCSRLALGAAVPDQKLRAIQRKYSSPEKGVVALLPPAKSLLPASNIHNI
ncbi:hypothetical protein Leryth_021876 [Lithospermum erythrorhizon]|nr:hypothetical protein Leryth_021876 [Lithospermum erythrorhizon]